MSGAALPSLDIQEQIVRIDRAIAETQKLQRESEKFTAEARKLGREYLYLPVVAGAAAVGGFLGAASLIARLLSKR